MGIANTQIATRQNVNSKRLGAFVTGTNGGTYMKKCVTKKAVTDIEYLKATDRKNTANILFDTNEYGNFVAGQNSMSITQGSTSSEYVNAREHVYIDHYGSQYSVAYVNMEYYAHSSESTTVQLTSKWPGTSSNDNYENVALFSKRLTNIPTNTFITINSTGFVNGNVSDSSFSGGTGDVSSYSPNSSRIYMGVVVTDDTGYVIASKSPAIYYSDINDSFSFSSTSSTINIYFIFTEIYVVFYPSEGYYTGLDLTIAVSMEYYASYYNQTYKLVQYQDIAMKGGTFPCACYIYNNKSSKARLDYVKARISLTSTVTQGTWTDIGSVNPGTVDRNSTWAGTIICTLPASIDLSKQYYFYVECGYTDANQNWYGGWGSPGMNYNATTYCGKTTWGYTPAVPLNSATGAAQTVLNYTAINSTSGASAGVLIGGLQGRTGTRTALFRIE